MKVRPTDADFAEACRRISVDWGCLKREAMRLAADRLLKANWERQNEIIGLLAAATADPRPEARAEWMQLQDEMSRVFAEHDELLALAFPEKRP